MQTDRDLFYRYALTLSQPCKCMYTNYILEYRYSASAAAGCGSLNTLSSNHSTALDHMRALLNTLIRLSCQITAQQYQSCYFGFFEEY